MTDDQIDKLAERAHKAWVNDEMVARASEVIKSPDGVAYMPIEMLKLVVALAERVKELESHRHDVRPTDPALDNDVNLETSPPIGTEAYPQ